MPTGNIADAVPHALAGAQGLIAEQRAYHARRAQRSRSAGHRLGHAGEALFIATGLVVFIKVVAMLAKMWFARGPGIEGTELWLGLLCGILAAFSASFVGIRAYAEFDLLRLQSERMRHLLDEAAEQLADVEIGKPLASQQLGTVLTDLALAMMQDIQGWSLLFRTKSPEAG